MGNFLYVRPDENWAYGQSVATTGGTLDADYLASWLTDGRGLRPVRATGTSAAWAVTGSAGEVGLVAVCHHNVSVGVAVSGGVSATLSAALSQPNGVFLNPFATVTPNPTCTSLTITVTGNALNVTIGELVAGKFRTLDPAPRIDGAEFGIDDYHLTQNGEFNSLMPYDRGMEGRTFKGSQYYTTAQRDLLIGWYRAQRALSRPSLVVPDDTVNDAWLVMMTALSWKPVAYDLWEVAMTFTEVPRPRWS